MFANLIVDQPDSLAVVDNALAVAKQLGYSSPADTRVQRIVIVIDRDDNLIADASLDTVADIEEVQQAAVFLEALVAEKFGVKDKEDCCVELRITDPERLLLGIFVGRQIVQDATCPAKTNYWIFRKLFHGEYPLVVHVHM